MPSSLDTSINASIRKLLRVQTSGAVPFWSNDTPEDLADSQPGTPWDRIIIAGRELPGLCEMGGTKKRRVDPKQTPGLSGATPTHLGFDPSEIRLQLFLWTEQHLRIFESLVPILQGRGKDGIPKPVQVAHPALALYRIKTLYFVALGLPRKHSIVGVKTIDLEATEFRPTGKLNVTDSPDWALTNLLDATPPVPFRPDYKPSVTVTGPATPRRADFGKTGEG